MNITGYKNPVLLSQLNYGDVFYLPDNPSRIYMKADVSNVIANSGTLYYVHLQSGEVMFSVHKNEKYVIKIHMDGKIA